MFVYISLCNRLSICLIDRLIVCLLFNLNACFLFAICFAPANSLCLFIYGRILIQAFFLYRIRRLEEETLEKGNPNQSKPLQAMEHTLDGNSELGEPVI